MAVNLEGLGKAISETIALKQLINKGGVTIAEKKGQIEKNKKEIARLQSLINANVELDKQVGELELEVTRNQDMLDTRLTKLKANGVELEPLTNSSRAFIGL